MQMLRKWKHKAISHSMTRWKGVENVQRAPRGILVDAANNREEGTDLEIMKKG